MRLPKSRRGGGPTGTDSADETRSGPAQTRVAVDHIAENQGSVEIGEPDHGEQPSSGSRRIPWSRVVAYGVVPGLALLLAASAGFLKWRYGPVRDAQVASEESVRAATDGTIALLSYRPDTVEKDLEAARDRLTGQFLDSYTSLTRDVVIPGAKQKEISAVATVPAAASTSASGKHAVALLFVNQTVAVGQDAPTDTTSSVRVTLEKIDSRWLISGFEPV